jgi:hypothetical protein
MFRASKQERKSQNDKANATISPPKTTNFAFMQRKCKGFANGLTLHRIIYQLNTFNFAFLRFAKDV